MIFLRRSNNINFQQECILFLKKIKYIVLSENISLGIRFLKSSLVFCFVLIENIENESYFLCSFFESCIIDIRFIEMEYLKVMRFSLKLI